jgi:hypothetical protein
MCVQLYKCYCVQLYTLCAAGVLLPLLLLLLYTRRTIYIELIVVNYIYRLALTVTLMYTILDTMYTPPFTMHMLTQQSCYCYLSHCLCTYAHDLVYPLL